MECVVCKVRVNKLPEHLQSHTKQQIVNALLRSEQSNARSNNAEMPGPSSSGGNPSEPHAGPSGLSGHTVSFSNPNHLQNFSHHNQLGNVRLENVMETRRENHERGSGEGLTGDGSQMIRNNVNRLDPRGIATVSGGMATLSQVVPGAGQAWNLADGSNLPPPSNEPRVFPGTTREIPSIQLVEPGINMASIANGYPANAINIQRTLNNVNIVNNIGTAQMITSTPGILNGHGQQIQGFGGAFIANPTMIGNVMMLGGFLQGSAGNGSQPTAFPMLTTATPILMPQVNGPTLLLNIPTAVSSAAASFTMPQQQQQQQQQQFVMFKPADVVQQNVASSSFSTTTTRAVVAPSVNSCVSLPTQPASSSRISHPLLPNYGLNETKSDESKPEVETRPVQGPSSSELRVERNIHASQQYAAKSPGENNTEHDDLDDENLEEAYNHEDVEVVENPGPSVSGQRIYNFAESSVSGDQAGMAPVVTLPSVSASYSMASTFTERSGHMEEVLIKQKKNTSEQNEASLSRREAHLDNPIPGTSRQKTDPVHPTSSKQYVISQVDSSRVIKLSHKVECEAIAECLDEDEKDVVFVDDENESEDEEILLDESSDEEQPSANDHVTTHNNSTNNLITHRKNKSTSEWAMENLRLQQSSAAAAASATISNVAAASSSVRNSFENAARKRYTDILSNVYENPKSLENAVVHDYSRQGTSRMTATRSRHDALVIEDNNVNNQQTMESNRESSSVIVSPNSMSHMSENAAAEVAGSSHATASSSKHNSRTSNSSRVSAEVSGSMVANGSCDSKQVEAIPLVSCEPSRTADDVEVVAAISPRIETHDFNSDEQVRSPITIHTVEELQNALASDKNVQLVVSNELLDTPEFKALIQNMQETNIPEDIISESYDGTRSTTIAASSMGGEDTRSMPGPSTTNSIEVSRETTRDGFDPFDAESSQSLTLTTSSSISQAQQHSAAADKQELSFSNLQQNDNYILSTVSDDDDITLQGINLIAVESIEDSQMSDDGTAVTLSAVGSRLSWQRTEQPVAATSSRTEHLQPEVLSVAGCSKSQDSCSNCGVFFNSWIDRQNHLCTQMKQDLRIKMFDRRQQIQNNSALKNHHEKRIIMDNSDDNALDLSSSSVVMAKKSSIANLNTTYTTVATAAATTSIASSSSGGGASRFDKVNIATKIEMMLSDDESNPDNELDDHDSTMDEGIDCDTEDDSYVEDLVKKEAGLDNKTQRLDNKTQGLDNKTRGLDNSAAQRQELDDRSQGPEVLDNKTQSPDNKAPIIKLVNTKFTVATQDPLAMPGNHWKCQHCKVIFPSSDQLIIHRQMFMSKAEDNFIKCIPCHVRFQERTELVNHVSTVHNFQNIPDNSIVFDPVPLGDPKEVATTAEGGIANLKLEAIDLEDSKFFVPNQNREYSCSWCDRAFKEASQLKKHLSCHLSEKPFECLQCGKRFMKMIHLKRHSLIHNEKKAYQCVLCYKGFHTASKLREHMRMHTGEAPLKCDLCDKWFKRHSNLSSHRKTHYPDKKEKPQKEIFCKDCGDMFTTKRDLVWHYEKKHNKVPNKCKECGEVFIHARSLTRHIRLKHDHNFVPKEIKVSNYAKCPICDLLFFKTSINKHIKVVHHNIRQFQCDICQKSFVSKHNLDTHVWQHKNKRARPWKCTKCNKINKPYVCNECGVQFSMRHNWKRHVEEHEGRRTYNCPECNKTFARSYYLADHLKVHSGEKPYLCGICGKSTATRSNYNSHLKTHTTREPVNSEI